MKRKSSAAFLSFPKSSTPRAVRESWSALTGVIKMNSMLRLVCFALLVASVPSAAFAKAKHSKSRENDSPRPSTKDALPNLRAESAMIIDLDTGDELFSKNPDQVRAIASVGKLFLALAVRGKHLPLDGVTSIQEEDRKFASGGARSRLPIGKTFTNHALLRAMLISSDNRACTAVGRGAGLDPPALIQSMNEV